MRGSDIEWAPTDLGKSILLRSWTLDARRYQRRVNEEEKVVVVVVVEQKKEEEQQQQQQKARNGTRSNSPVGDASIVQI